MAVSVASLNPTNTTNLSSTAAGGLNSSSTGTSNRGNNSWQLALNFGGDLNGSLTGPSLRSTSTATPARGGQMESPAHASSPDTGSSSHPSPSSNGINGLPYPTTGAGNPFTPQGAAGTGWTPSPNAAPFYPQFTPFYPHTHTPVSGTGTPPTGVPIPQLGGAGALPPGAQGFGYFNPAMQGMGGGMDANQQIAWAYQQMMLQQAALAQQHQNQFNAAMAELGRTRANSHGNSSPAGQIPMPGAEFFPPNVNPALLPGFPFQAGTPPAHGHGYQGGTPQQQQSYRGRNLSGGSGVGPQGHLGALRSNTFDNQDWSRLTAQGLPVPYARPEAAGSSHSVSSNGSGGGPAGRARTNSNNTNRSQTPPSSLRGQSHHHGSSHGSSHGSGQSTPTRGTTVPQLTTDFDRRQQHNRLNSSNPPSPAGPGRSAPHQRSVSNTSSDRSMSTASGRGGTSPTISNSNQTPSISASSAAPSSTTSSPNHSPLSRTNQRAPTKPSPLSQQQTFSSSSPAIGEGTTSKRAKRLSKDDSELLPQATVASALTPRQSGLKGRFKRALAFNPPSSVDEHGDSSSIGHGDISPNGTSPYGASNLSQSEAGHDSPVTPINDKPKSRARQLFSGKFNASTDNISLSSTVSSASVMIRKLGSIGQLARRNTLTNIKGIFKGDKKEKGESPSAKKAKDKKSAVSEPSVTHATVELDRGEDDSMVGLTPAARVARQHTLKSNAEAARRLREQAAATAAAQQSQQAAGVPSWEKSTTNRRGEANAASRGVSEDGTLNESDDGSGEGGYDPAVDPDATLRMNAPVDLVEETDEEEELWAIGIRRSLERTRQPGRPVIRNHVGYIQEQHLDPPNAPFAARIRSNSYQTVAESQPGPLAHLPPQDPGQIDGLQRSSSTHNTPEKKSFSLPAFNFEFGMDGMDILSKETESPQQEVLSSTGPAGALATAADKGPTFAYTHTTANSSAPALSTMFPNEKTGGASASQPSNSLTMKKNISFAATLSIYDTFSGSVYDRRSEPSTANRLTPALAQRIKEELNSYKMEEMEVHSASKIHTHFFV